MAMMMHHSEEPVRATKRTRPKKRDTWPVVSITEQIASCPDCGGDELKHLHGESQDDGKFRIREKRCRSCGCEFVVYVEVEVV